MLGHKGHPHIGDPAHSDPPKRQRWKSPVHGSQSRWSRNQPELAVGDADFGVLAPIKLESVGFDPVSE